MSLDPAVPVIPTVVRGEDKYLNIKLDNANTGDPYDLSLATEIDAVFEKTDGTCIHKLLSLTEVVVTNGPAGKLRIQLNAADTALLALSPEDGYSDIELRITIASKLNIVQLVDVFKVVQKLFPNC